MQVNLFYTNGSSDKVYQASIEAVEGGHIVNFQYGRRGSALRSGTKTKDPVDYEKAKKIFDKLIASKKSKGYTEDTSGEAYINTDKADSVSGIVCQLLNPIERNEAEALCLDPNYCAQEKHDGERRPIERKDGAVSGINRKGLYVGGMATPTVDAVNNLPVDSIVIDGEDMGVQQYIFDLLELNGVDYRKQPYSVRLEKLYEVLAQADQDILTPVETAYTTEEKRALLARVEAEGGEGVVFKRLDAEYTEGRPASGGTQLKHKFYADCSAIVEAQNGDRRSVALSLLDESGNKIGVGNCTIPANYLIPEVGSIVEIKYLYAYPNGGSLYQPQYKGERTDVDPSECKTSQLKYKAAA